MSSRTVTIDSDKEVVVPRELIRLAIQVALDAPLRRSRGYAATVRWDTVIALRAQLEAIHVDWRAHHHQSKRKEVNRVQS